MVSLTIITFLFLFSTLIAQSPGLHGVIFLVYSLSSLPLVSSPLHILKSSLSFHVLPPLIPHRRENVQHICKSCSFVYTMYLLLRQCLGRGFEFSVAEDDLGFLIFLVRHRSASDGAWNMVPGTEARAVCVLSRSTSPHHDVSRSSHMIAGRTAFPKGFFFLLVSRSLAPSFPDWD